MTDGIKIIKDIGIVEDVETKAPERHAAPLAFLIIALFALFAFRGDWWIKYAEDRHVLGDGYHKISLSHNGVSQFKASFFTGDFLLNPRSSLAFTINDGEEVVVEDVGLIGYDETFVFEVECGIKDCIYAINESAMKTIKREDLDVLIFLVEEAINKEITRQKELGIFHP